MKQNVLRSFWVFVWTQRKRSKLTTRTLKPTRQYFCRKRSYEICFICSPNNEISAKTSDQVYHILQESDTCGWAQNQIVAKSRVFLCWARLRLPMTWHFAMAARSLNQTNTNRQIAFKLRKLVKQRWYKWWSKVEQIIINVLSCHRRRFNNNKEMKFAFD